MARYSPIAPIGLLRQLEFLGLSGNYILVLAHDVLKHRQGYEEFAYNLRQAPDSMIILDNGVIEQGAPIKLSALLEAANIVGADVVCSPDVLGDYLATRSLCEAQVDLIRASYPVMLIPQGKDIKDIGACIDWMYARFVRDRDSEEPQWWGIPRWFTNEHGTRQGVINYIFNYCSPAKIHLLGMSKNLEDDVECSRHPAVVGIDSANPLVLAHNGIKMSPQAQHLDRGDYWEQVTLTPMMIANVEWTHHVFAGK